MGKFSDLSRDEVVEIMSWLPPELLLKFKLVGKSWHFLINDLIRDQKFANKNLRNNTTSCLVFEGMYPPISSRDLLERADFSLKIFNRHDDTKYEILGELKQFLVDMRLPLPRTLSLVGYHCNGIVCVYNDRSGDTLLINPITKQCKFLLMEAPSRYYANNIGFGYDPITDAYKVVTPSNARVYTLGDGGSVWREINARLDVSSHQSPAVTEMYCVGAYYSLAVETEAIHSFDFHEETFREVALPDELTSITQFQYGTRLMPRNESVALFYRSFETWEVSVWVMTSNSTRTNHQTINFTWLRKISLFPVAFLTSNRLLLKHY